jgi:hypothetical protein
VTPWRLIGWSLAVLLAAAATGVVMTVIAVAAEVVKGMI